MFKLENLKSLIKKRKRVGRGGKRGGNSCRGAKGQKSRSGDSIPAFFEGGQMPLVRRLPKRGFNNARFAQNFAIINLRQLDTVFTEGDVVDQQALFEKGLLKGKKIELVKILGSGTLSKKLIVHADAFSKKAEEEIKRVGGQVRKIQES